MAAVPPIDSLFFAYKKFPTNSTISFRSGVEVFGTWQDPENERNFYLWKNSGTYLIETHPELFTIRNAFREVIPAPKDCCAICWLDEQNGDNAISIFKDNNSDGRVNSSLMAFIEDNGARFFDKYRVEIHQMSISKSAYQFFDMLSRQLSIDGDIFDPSPATIRGNIINLSDPDANVIGYFYASDVKSKSIFLPKEILQDTQRSLQVNDDCRELQGATTVEPPFWD